MRAQKKKDKRRVSEAGHFGLGAALAVAAAAGGRAGLVCVACPIVSQSLFSCCLLRGVQEIDREVVLGFQSTG